MKNSVIYLFAMLLFGSCAIHFKYPFICFEKACLAEQWHIRDIRASVKVMKGKANKRKQLRAAKNRKKDNGNIDVADNTQENLESGLNNEKRESSDSVLSFSFERNTHLSDTLIIIKYSDDGDFMSRQDSLFLSKYIERQGANFITEIRIQEFVFPDSNEKNRSGKTRIIDNLEKLGVRRNAIISDRNKHTNDKTMIERVEFRIKTKN